MKLKLLIAKGLKHLLQPPALRDCSIDPTARVCPKSELSSVRMGRYSYIGNDCFAVNTRIGAFCSIADRCCIGGAQHPVERVSTSPVFHSGRNVLGRRFAEHPAIQTPETVIGSDVWIGMGCLIKAGVRIGDGAVIGMGSVVTHDVPAYEIWSGVPARKLRNRFAPEIARRLERSAWWEFEEQKLTELGGCFDDPQTFLERVELP